MFYNKIGTRLILTLYNIKQVSKYLCKNRMTFLQRNRDELELENIKVFSQNLQTLQFFLNNVSLQISPFKRFQTLHEVGKTLRKQLAQHKQKIFKLWKQFIERMNQKNLGITIIHVYFLECAINQSQYKLALNVIQNSGLPITITTSDFHSYLIYAATVYNEFQRYIQSFQCLNMALSLECSHFEGCFFILKYLVVVSRILGSKFGKQQFNRQFDRIKVLCNRDLKQYERQQHQKLNKIQFEHGLFQKISQDQQLKAQQLSYLNRIYWSELYLKATTSQSRQLKKYIQRQIKDSTCYRIKCTQINNHPINDFKTIRDINKQQSIYKYDMKDKIMYFNNTRANSQQLNDIVNKTCQLQNILKNRPLEVRPQRTQDDELGDMRALGRHGFGSGMAGLGEMLGLFRHR